MKPSPCRGTCAPIRRQPGTRLLLIGLLASIVFISSTGAAARELALLREAGLSGEEVIAAATETPARMLGLDGQIGTVQVGKRADLVLVRGDPLSDPHAFEAVAWSVRDGVAKTPAEWMSAP